MGEGQQYTRLIGRERELNELRKALGNARDSKGSTVLISGEAGIGKTRLTEEMKKIAQKNTKVLCGAASPDTVHPFLTFATALEMECDGRLFEEREFKMFSKIFTVNTNGLLLGQASPEGVRELDADVFAGILSAVQDFIRDSFDRTGEPTAGLGRLEYGDLKVLIEHGEHLSLAAVLKGAEHTDMKKKLKITVDRFENEYGGMVASLSGGPEALAPVQEMMSSLADVRFLVKKDLEGMRLENERIRIADKVLEILMRASKEKPLVIILEDLHWADEASLFVLSYIARNIQDERILVLGTLRPWESQSLQKCVEGMREENTIREMTLESLGGESLSCFVGEIYPKNNFPHTFIRDLFLQCEGNPFFVKEMLWQMNEDGNITTQDGRYVLVSQEYTIPGSVENLVQRRLHDLEPDALVMAEYVSCIGREFDRSTALALQYLGDAPSALEQLQRSGVITFKNGKAEFSHAIFHDVTYGSVRERWKQAYHKSIGEYYESVYDGRLDEVLYELAKHFSRSREHEKAYDYCVKAGEKAEGALAPEQAIEFYTRALNAPKTGGRTAGEERELLSKLGDLHLLIGKYDDAIDYYSRAKEKAKEKENMAELHKKMAQTLEKMGEYKASLRECGKGLGLLGDWTHLETSRIMVVKGLIQRRIGEYDAAQETLISSLEIARGLKSEKDVANAEHAIGNIYLAKHHYDKALEHFLSAEAVFEALDDQPALANILSNKAAIYHFRGDLSAALEHHKKSLEIRERANDMNGIMISLNNIGNVYNVKGELDKAFDYYTRSLDKRKRAGDKKGIANTLSNLGVMYKARGDLDKALEHYQMSLDLKERIGVKSELGSTLVNMGKLFLEREEHDKALEYYGRALTIREELGDMRGLASVHSMISEAFLELKDFEKALNHIHEAIEISEGLGIVDREGPNHIILGRIYRDMGDWEGATASFRRAIDRLRSIGETSELANALYGYGLMWKMKGDKERAREALERAHEIYTDMGKSIYIKKTEKELEELERV